MTGHRDGGGHLWHVDLSGEIAISPPLAWEEIVDGPPLAGLRLRLAGDGEDTRAYDAAAPATGRDIVAELQALVDAHGETHRFTGHIEARDVGEVRRLAVRDGRAEWVEPRLVWPGEIADLAAENARLREALETVTATVRQARLIAAETLKRIATDAAPDVRAETPEESHVQA